MLPTVVVIVFIVIIVTRSRGSPMSTVLSYIDRALGIGLESLRALELTQCFAALAHRAYQHALLRERVRLLVSEHRQDVSRELDAFKVLSHCRRDLAQRNANPQMVAEHGLFAVREAIGR